jgi:trimeric autotransporter adhesin
MKKNIFIIVYLACNAVWCAQDKMYIHLSNKISLGVALSEMKDMTFSNDGSFITLSVGDTVVQYARTDLDSISFAASSDTVYINYHDTFATVINPLAFAGVSVSVQGASVTVRAAEEAKNVNYKLTGTTANGQFKIYSEKKFSLFFNGLNITNPNGPAINNQANKKVTVHLMAGTTNTLTDGSSYTDSIINEAGQTEEQGAAFFSEGSLTFMDSGSLTIYGKGSKQHALCSDDLIQVDGGHITIASAVKDGIHANDGIVITNGVLNVTATGDAIDADEGYIDISGGSITTRNSFADTDGLSCDSTLVMTNGVINITISGDQTKGIKSGKNITLTGGTIAINASGNAVLETSGSGFDPSYCTAIKCDSVLTINGADITITHSGKGGKGISSDRQIIMMSGSVNITTSGAGATYRNAGGVTDAYNATCMTADGNITLLGGSITTKSSGAAGKGITADGALTAGDANNSPVINVTTTGSKITISGGSSGGPGGGGMTGDYAEAKGISCDGAVTVNNGVLTISSADDGIKSATSITINNGAVSITNSTEGMEAPLINVKDGHISIVATDDGFNATKGNGGEANDGSYLYLNGGAIFVNTTNGDGLDSNGNIVMTAGTVVVNGPQSQPEVGADYNGTFNISGGLLLVTGPNSGNMIEATSSSSAQYAIKATANSSLNSSTLFHIQDAGGKDLVTYKPVRNVYYVVFSSPELKSGSTYYIYTGGTSTGTYTNGLYVGGIYSGGTLKKSVTVSGKVTNVSF